MPVIAVINRKGGSGKSTLATHLAAWLAREGVSVLLGDIDRQQSTRAWLKLRGPQLPVIVPWAMDKGHILKKPAGITHVVLDTPGGLHGFELAKVVMSSDAILIPVCNSLFDRDSAAACYGELMTLPRVVNGRCKLGVVGMRIDSRTRSAETLRGWAATQSMNFLGVLRETQTYVRSLETGQTLFDMPSPAVNADLIQWEPVLQWLRPIARIEQPTVQTSFPAEPSLLVTPCPEMLGSHGVPTQPTLAVANPLSALERYDVPPNLLRHPH